MASQDKEFWSRARLARDALSERLLNHPDVTLIDIGYDPASTEAIGDRLLVLRIHVRRSLTRSALGLPDTLDGIPIVLVVADYTLE
ncbi:MAG: hypothetical protein KDJ65_36910 [Anaerolineae bacterium]|nr:hypothetical protein [Anaerolineae bacterium]